MNPSPKNSPLLAGTKVVFVVAPMEYRDEELDVPIARVSEAGAGTAISSPKPGRCRGMLGGEVEAHLSTSSLLEEDWDAVVVVGGMGSPEHLWNDEPLLGFLRAMQKGDKPIAGICLSGAVLAGVLKGKNATCWPDEKAIERLRVGGAHYEKAPVLLDGNILTGEGPHAADEFATALVELLAKRAPEKG
jgi:protease I